LAFLIYRVAGSHFDRTAIVSIVLLFSVLSWSAQRPWRNQTDLYAHAATAEPLSVRLQFYQGRNALNNREVSTAAWHFMERTYIMSNFPGRVDPTPILRLERLPVEQRIVEGPAVFSPENPCRFLGAYFQFLQSKTPHMAPYMRNFLSKRYPGCVEAVLGSNISRETGELQRRQADNPEAVATKVAPNSQKF